mgnify:CR=1 FL=1
MKKVCVLLADGFEEIEGLTVVDLLRRAKIYVDTVSIMDDYIVHGAHGINVQTEDLFDEVDFEEFDMVVLPGGMPGTLNLKEHDGVRYVVKQYAKEGRFVGAICAAPTILKSLGLLEGRRATCYPGVEDEMENVILTETAVVVDDNIITSQGVGTAIDFALKLIEVLDGEEKAKGNRRINRVLIKFNKYCEKKRKNTRFKQKRGLDIYQSLCYTSVVNVL